MDRINSKTNTNKQTFIQKYCKSIEYDKLPKDVKISTMTITCEFNVSFMLENINAYIDLNIDIIQSVSYGPNSQIERSLIPKKVKQTRKKNNSKSKQFYNQVTFKIKPNKDGKPINMKIFRNGAIQMTGCRSLEDCYDVLQNMCNELSKVKAIIDTSNLNSIILKPFIDKAENLNLDKIKEFKVCMINSGFNIGFSMDRIELNKVLQDEKLNSSFQQDGHASVDIKYMYKNKTISIFIFEQGSIIITGANSCEHILEAYKMIVVKLFDNYRKIKKVDINNIDLTQFLRYT